MIIFFIHSHRIYYLTLAAKALVQGDRKASSRSTGYCAIIRATASGPTPEVRPPGVGCGRAGPTRRAQHAQAQRLPQILSVTQNIYLKP